MESLLGGKYACGYIIAIVTAWCALYRLDKLAIYVGDCIPTTKGYCGIMAAAGYIIPGGTACLPVNGKHDNKQWQAR